MRIHHQNINIKTLMKLQKNKNKNKIKIKKILLSIYHQNLNNN